MKKPRGEERKYNKGRNMIKELMLKPMSKLGPVGAFPRKNIWFWTRK